MNHSINNLKKQLRFVYLYSFASCLRPANAVWVVLLAARGFSLWQIGAAEGIFHITSLLCEIPSGMASDLMGRKRSLALSGVLGAASGLAMIAGGGFGWVCLSMVFSALSYNLISGTQEALTYDSLVAADRADDYLQIDANVSILQTLGWVINDLCSLLTGVLSYVGLYLLEAVVSLSRTAATLGLTEPVVTEKQKERQAHPFAALPQRFREHVSLSVGFLIKNPAVARKIAANAFISLPSYLTMMFLQQRLSELGLPSMFIGIPLLCVELMRMVGTTIGRRLKPVRLLGLYGLCAVLGGLGTLMAGAAPIALAVAGAMLATGTLEIWYLHVQRSLNDSFPSDQRATLVSVDSMAYSVLMILASPLVGWLGDAVGTAGAGLCVMGAAVALTGAVAGVAALLQRSRARSRAKHL